MVKIGLTGGIGSGKSSAAMAFEALGYPVFYSDIVAKTIMKTTLKNKISEILGEQAFDCYGEINRIYIGEKIFNDKNLLAQINNIVHPAVTENFIDWCNQMEKNGAKIAIVESAILFESKLDKIVQYVVAVVAEEGNRIRRTIKRDKLPENQVIAKMKTQTPQNQMVEKANFVVNTDNKFITPQVLDIIKFLLPLHC